MSDHEDSAEKLDEVLQTIVERAKAAAHTPIALLSFIREYTQHFRAHVGLPPGLQVTQATSACDSFCQFVVRDARAWFIEDAASRTDLPQNLVEQLGVRAYLGQPVYVGGVVRASLCVIDVVPRQWDQPVWERTADLAEQAGHRLEVLASGAGSPGPDPMRDELHAFVELLAAVSDGPLTIEDARVALSVLGQPIQLLRRLQHDRDARHALEQAHGLDLSELSQELAAVLSAKDTVRT